jgi:PAS domain S-box-containing protein
MIGEKSLQERWFGSWRPSVVGGIVFAVCVAITAVVHLSFLRFENEQDQIAFEHHVGEQLRRLHETARMIEGHFEGIRILMEFSAEVTRAEFEGAARRLLQSYPALDAVEWAPFVPHSDRGALEATMKAKGLPDFVIHDRVGTVEPMVSQPATPAEGYLPVIFRRPPFARESLYGFNMFSALRRVALIEAQESGRTLMSSHGQLLERPIGELGFILFVPVYHETEDQTGSPHERGPFRGMIQGVIRLEPFLTSVFVDRTTGPRHELMIEDAATEHPDTLIGLLNEANEVILKTAPNRERFNEPGVVRRQFELWGRNLNLAFRPLRPNGERSIRHSTDIISGLLVSTAFGLLAFSLARRSSLVEQQVEQRTEELKTIQLELERDIAQRVEVETQLRVSEQRYRSLFDLNPDGVYSSDLQGRFLSANQGMERITGYSISEVIGMSCQEVTAPESLGFSKMNFNRAAAGESVVFEHVGIRKDGTPFNVSLTQLPIVVDGKIVGVYGIAKDLAEVKRAARELESFFDLSAEMMGIATSDGFFRRVNRAFEHVSGYRDGELTVWPFIDFIHPDDQEATKTEIAKLGADLTTIAFENRFRTQKGDFRTLAWSIRSIPDEDILYAVAHDVTDRRQKELQIREQASLLDKAQDAILVYDLQQRISYWNKSAERVYGWSSADAIGRDVRALIYHDQREAFDAAHAALLKAGEWTGELKQTARDGRAIVGEARWTLVRKESGEPYSVLSITTDITEQKKVEAQFLRVQRVESLGTLASGIAHDLNNVLAPILMAVGLLKQSHRDENDLKILDSVATSAQRGADLVKQILSFARGDEGQRIPTPPGHLFREIANVINETFPKSLHCDIRLPKDIWPIVGDPTQLHQVLLNLCLNARDAMPAGGTLTLAAENIMLDEHYVAFNREGHVGPYVILTVSDTGTGIPPAIRDKVFDPFFTTKEVGKGTGLGLSTVLTIVRTNRGFLRLASDMGKGTTFRIYFPAEPLPQAVAPVNDSPDLPRGNGELILIVDDEESVRTITRRTLEAFGYRVAVATNGAEALVIYVERQHEVAVVLTDIMMPIMDGPALIRALHNLDGSVRIIAASGLHAAGSETRVSDVGVKEFLPKPYTTAAMLQVLARILKANGEKPFR